MATEAPYKAIARRKQAERESRIPSEWRLSSPPSSNTLDVRSIPRTSGILSSKELEITGNYDATSLAQAIGSGSLTAEQVTIAFCKRAAIAQQVCNCLTEIFFGDAIARAKYLDREYKKTGRVVGPLHGVPISLKDMFKVKGYDTSIGLASLAENPSTENAALVDILLEQGAVLYCKTNVPQTLMALDSDNHLFGRTLNPRDRRVTAGGSSGGEGALVAMRGSLLGVGTDIGGSIRIPAMVNGVYGIKPSSRRVPDAGLESGAKPGARQVGLTASAGPIAVSMRDCELFLKTVSNAQPWEKDPDCIYGRWEEQGSMAKKPLLGVIRTDDLITPLPPVSKALDEAVQTLRKSGVEVVEIDAPAFKKCQSLANSFFGIDGANSMFDLLEKTGEPLTNWLSTRLRRKAPTQLDKIVGFYAKKTELETEILKIWKDPKTGRQIDAFVCPVAPHPTPPIDRWNGVSYTSSFVLLDYPAGTLPVRDFKEADLHGEVTTPVLGSWDKANRALWDTKNIDRRLYLNTKLTIQVVAPKLQERRLYQAMELIDNLRQTLPRFDAVPFDMASMQSRVPKLRDHWEQTHTRHNSRSEEVLANELKNRVREIQDAPLLIDPTEEHSNLPSLPERRASYIRRPAPQPSPPLSPIERPGSHPERREWEPSWSSNINAPPSPESPKLARAPAARTQTESPPTQHDENSQAIQLLQAQLDEVKAEIEQIKQQRDESDRQVATLNTRLEEATRRATEVTLENSNLRKEIQELREMLRDAGLEETKLREEMKEMKARERRLEDEFDEAQRKTRDPVLSLEKAPSVCEGDKRGSGHRKKSSGGKEYEVVLARSVQPGARASWRLPGKSG
ncbi:putative amidase [Lachnellula suecica]|uniref:amidase n=1 Tax=Lachnellula suecica TaxID=602035 RepID=A0A8T9CGR2_9HELO|nr:putative amidase [Lachnellula suecica]